MPENVPKEPSDSGRLLEECKSGKQAALDTLLVRHLRPLRAYVRLQMNPGLRARESESDVIQDVCLNVLRRADRFEFRGESEFRGWLYGAVLHAIRDGNRYHHAKRRAAERDVPITNVEELAALYASISTPSERAVAKEQVEQIEEAFTRLPEHYAEVLAMAHVAGLSRSEIATRLSVTPDGAAKLLRRATVRLAKELGQKSA